MSYTFVTIRPSDGARVRRKYHDSGVMLSEKVVSPSTPITSSEAKDKLSNAAGDRLAKGIKRTGKKGKRRKVVKSAKGLCTHEQVKNKLLMKKLSKIRKIAS